MKRPVRIKDIALKAGVSTGTVDRVLHNRGKVSPKTEEKVLKAIQELGYKPNIMASTLAYGKTIRIGILLPNFEQDAFWVQPKEGIENAWDSVSHYSVVLENYYFDLYKASSFVEKSEELLANAPDFVILAPIFQEESKPIVKKIEEANIPYIMINTNLPDAEPLCYIGQDSYQSGVLAGRILDFRLSDGDAVMILHLETDSSNATHLIQKDKGFKDYFANIKDKKVETLRYELDGEDAASLKASLVDLVRIHSNLKGVFVSTSKAYKIADFLPEYIKLVGFDLIADNLAFLASRKIDFLINQNAYQQGFRAIRTIYEHHILKKEVAKINYLPLDIVVSENVEYYLDRDLPL